MATKSFLKNIVIKDGKQAERFLKALENAEKKKLKIQNKLGNCLQDSKWHIK